jgi:hypothetical protein
MDMIRNKSTGFLLTAFALVAFSMISHAQTLRKPKDRSFVELSILDSMADIRIDTGRVYASMDEAKQEIVNITAKEFSLLTDTVLTKAVMAYNYYSAKKYGNRLQCVKNYKKKDLLKRWMIRPVYKTVRDTFFEERKDLTGINFGSNHNPAGTCKPITWHTKYSYDCCLISLRGCSNMDGEDNFLLYRADGKGKDTICNIKAPSSADFGRQLYKKNHQFRVPSPIYIKIYNSSNTHFSPGACSAFLVVRPKYPRVVTRQKIKKYKISLIR